MSRLDPTNHRVCQGPCQRMLPVDDFDKDRSKPDGYKSYCKTCRAAKRQAKQLDEMQSEIEKAVQKMDAEAILKIRRAAGGTNLPHQVEALEAIMSLVGGVGGFAAFYVSCMLAAPAGSPIRSKMLDKLLNMIQLCSDDARVEMPDHLKSTEELRENAIKLLGLKVIDGQVREIA